MKILVTGATGFVGSHLCDLLEKNGHQVWSLARSQKKVKEFNVPGTIVEGSLDPNTPPSWIASLPNDLDAVIHTAGIVHSFNPKEFYQINTQIVELFLYRFFDRFIFFFCA